MAEMLPDLVTRLRLDTTEMEQGVSRASAIGGAIGGALGAVAVAGLGKAADAIKDFVSGSVQAYSDLEDASAAASVVFGDSMADITAKAKGASAELGISQAAAIDAANTFGTLGKAAGLTGGDLSGFSNQMLDVAGGLASFKGGTVEEAIGAVGAALRGEAEPIRRYGILLDDASLKAQAAAMGIYSGTAPLTQSQKVLAAQAAITAQAGDALGDFTRTADSTANVQKRLAAETDNLQATFGSALAPAFTAVRQVGIGFVTSLSAGLERLAPSIQAFYDRASAALGGLRELFASGDITSGLLSGLGVEEDSPVIGFLLTLRDTAANVATALGPILSSVGAAFGTAFAGVGEAFSGVLPGLLAAVQPLGEAFAQLLPALAPLIPAVLQVVSSFSPLHLLLQVLVPILPTLVSALSQVAGALLGAAGTVLPVVVQLAQALAGSLIGALQAVLPVVAQVAVMLAQLLAGAVQQLMPAVLALVPVVAQLAATLGAVLGDVIAALMPIVLQLVGVIVQLLPPILSLIGPILGMVQALLPLVGVVGQLIATILPPLLDLFMAILDPVIELVAVLADALVPILEGAAQVMGTVLVPILSTVIGWIAQLIGWVLQLAGPILGGLVGMIGNVIGWFARVVSSIAQFAGSIVGGIAAVGQFAAAVGARIGEAVQWFVGLPGRVLSAIGNVGRTLWSVGTDMIQGFINGLGSMAGRIISAVREAITDKLPSFVKQALGISSPSRVFRQLGRWTGEGFAQGLEDETAGVGDAAQRMVDQVAGVNVAPPSLSAVYGAVSQPTGGLAGQGSGYGGGAAVQVRVYIGDTELTGIVRTEVVGVLDEEAQAISVGSVS